MYICCPLSAHVRPVTIHAYKAEFDTLYIILQQILSFSVSTFLYKRKFYNFACFIRNSIIHYHWLLLFIFISILCVFSKSLQRSCSSYMYTINANWPISVRDTFSANAMWVLLCRMVDTFYASLIHVNTVYLMKKFFYALFTSCHLSTTTTTTQLEPLAKFEG